MRYGCPHTPHTHTSTHTHTHRAEPHFLLQYFPFLEEWGSKKINFPFPLRTHSHTHLHAFMNRAGGTYRYTGIPVYGAGTVHSTGTVHVYRYFRYTHKGSNSHCSSSKSHGRRRQQSRSERTTRKIRHLEVLRPQKEKG